MAKEQIPKQEMKKAIGKQAALEAVRLSEGGRFIMDALKTDILACIDGISLKYMSLTHAELIALSARLAERISVFRVISGASKRKKLAMDDLDAFLKENPNEK